MDEYVAKTSNVARRCVNIYMKPLISAIRACGMYKYLKSISTYNISGEMENYDTQYVSAILAPFVKYCLSCDAGEIKKMCDFIYLRGIISFDNHLVEVNNEKSKRCLKSILKIFLRCRCVVCATELRGVHCYLYFNTGFIGMLTILGMVDDFDLAISILDKCDLGKHMNKMNSETMKMTGNFKLTLKLQKYYSSVKIEII